MLHWQLVQNTMRNRRAQILLPAVMLAPIFILVVYLLFETSKLSMTKVRQQFALDNSAYSQMSSASAYLNALAMINGPLPYRVMKSDPMNKRLPKYKTDYPGPELITVFDVFYQAGAFPAVGGSGKGDKSAIENPSPAAESTNWNLQYYGNKRANWNKEDPSDLPQGGSEEDKAGEGGKIQKSGSEEVYRNHIAITSRELVDNYYFDWATIGLDALKNYLITYLRTASIYSSQTYVYQTVVKNSQMFRQSYWLNTRNCKKSECGKQAGAVLDRYILETKPYEVDDIGLWMMSTDEDMLAHTGAYFIELTMTDREVLGAKLFQFAYLTPNSRVLLKQMKFGLTLKQKFALPDNRFDVNLTRKYKPYVKNTVYMYCPRGSNNCVWPNPLPKYSVRIGV